MTSGSDGRDDGIERVTREEWQRRAREFVFRRVSKGWEGLFEDIRTQIEQTRGYYPPHHHNAWGALAMYCIRQGWLEPTGRYSNARSRATHAHRCQILKKVA
jgi:transposase